ncbi:DegT/DnrJ/EryC1/StrS family aminotransferase [Amycolatopsis decaplanina]|uniref:DegT/DnrJ/EryC1/StrS aminotransferase family protein n=1 Tax=Amycolatopsis decaplanina DSM 44594 TaxID=1284240 RepID=M2X965_9PSEU|nr:DegT/DnrJ/EryC1/StrS aminotransferase family protein [Amycolatopsis decaplanina]EME57651.1 DegT/DnrJ/EryC1/StrS aminotransferase family protein [Amycolatopsis decaplanina DSM 44594]
MTDAVIPPFKVELGDDEIGAALAGIEEVLRAGRFVLGPKTSEFEQTFASFVAGREVVAVSTGTTALEIIFRGLEVQGREVLVPANTNFATARAVLAAGGRPVFYDGGLFLSPSSIEASLTPAVAAVVVVHIGGHLSADLPRLQTLLRDREITLVEDAAHAHGSSLGGVPAGAHGDLAAFSFFPTKVVTTFEGGAVVAPSPAFARTVRIYRDQGKGSDGLHQVEGNSWRMSEAGAVLGIVQLKRFEENLSARAEVLRRYRAGLADVPGISFPVVPAGSRLSGHKAIALLEEPGRREAVARALAAEDISLAGGVYSVPLHRQPVFAEFAGNHNFPLADSFAAAHLCLPIWASMRDDEIDRTIGALARALK